MRVRPLWPLNAAGDLGDFGLPQAIPGQFGEIIVQQGPVIGLDTLVFYEAGPEAFPELDQLTVIFSREGDLAIPLDAYAYAIEFEGEGTIDAYIHDGVFVERLGEPDAILPDDRINVNSPADADLIIAAASVTTSDRWQASDGSFLAYNVGIGDRSSFSSAGPRRDNVQKPDIAAPGEVITSPLSADEIGLVSSITTPDARTSASTAYVTGAVALLLEQNRDLSARQIVDRIRLSGTNGIWTPELGTGLLNPFALLGVPEPPTGVRATVSGTTATLRWNAVSGATSYRVTVGATTSNVASGTTFQVTNLTNTTVLATVVALNSAGRISAPSQSVALSSVGARLGAPMGVRVQNLDGGFTVKWSAVEGASSYRVNWGLGQEIRPNVVETADLVATVRNATNGVAYFVSVTALDAAGNAGAASVVLRVAPRPNPSLNLQTIPTRSGFPVEAGHDFFGGPAVADVDGDGDGRLEIFAGAEDGKVYAYKSDGSPLPGWPQDAGVPVIGAVAIADLDGDGTLEIGAAAGRRIHVWNANGTRRRNFPLSTPNVVRGNVVFANVNDDAALEIVAAVSQGQPGVYAWNAAGVPLDGFPFLADEGAYIYTSPIIADRDYDGESEIYVGALYSALYGWSLDGEVLEGFPVNPNGGGLPAQAFPIAAALQDDVLTLLFGARAVGAVGYNGPLAEPEGIGAVMLGSADSGVSVGDLDGDGIPEFVAADASGYVYAFRADGSVMDNFPVAIEDTSHTTPLLADLDGDGSAEIIAVGNVTQNFGSTVFFIRSDGEIFDYVRADVNILGTPTLADLDGDGDAELIATTLRRAEDPSSPDDFPALGGRVFVWDLPYTVHRADFTTHQGNVARTGIASFNLPPSAVIENTRGNWRDQQLRLSWRSLTERGNLGWRVERSDSPTGPFVPVKDLFVRSLSHFRNEPRDYNTVDVTAEPSKTYYYRLVNIGTMNRSQVSDVFETRPRGADTLLTQLGKIKQLEVFAAFPSPANPEAWIPFALGEDARVTITLYDLSGALVRELDLGDLPSGWYATRDRAAHWDGRNTTGERVSSGVYIYQVTAGSAQSSPRRVLVIK